MKEELKQYKIKEVLKSNHLKKVIIFYLKIL